MRRHPEQILILSVILISITILTIAIYTRPHDGSGTPQPETSAVAAPSAATGGSTAEEYAGAWLTPLSTLELAELSTSNASALSSIGRLGRGIPRAISESPKGNQIAVGTTTGISVIDMQSSREILYIEEHAKVASVSYSPDGSRLVAGLSDGRLVVHDADSGALRTDIQYLSSSPFYDPSSADYDLIAAFALDGQYVIGSLESPYFATSVDAFDAASGEKRFSFPPSNPISDVDCSVDGQYIAVGSAPITILNGATGEVLWTVNGVEGQVGQVKFSADAKSLAIATRDNGIYVWDPNSESVIKHISAQQLQVETVDHMDFAGDGKEIVFNDDSNIGLFSLETDQLIWHVKTSDDPIYALELKESPDMVISGGMDGLIRFLSVSDRKEIKTLRSGYRKMGDLDFSPDSTLLGAGHWEKVDLWRVPSGILQTELPGGSSGLLAFSPNGKNIAVDRGDGLINLWDLETGSIIGQFKGGRGMATAIDFLQGGEILASAFDDPVVALESVSEGKIIIDFPGSS